MVSETELTALVSRVCNGEISQTKEDSRTAVPFADWVLTVIRMKEIRKIEEITMIRFFLLVSLFNTIRVRPC